MAEQDKSYAAHLEADRTIHLIYIYINIVYDSFIN